MHFMDAKETYREKAWQQLLKNAPSKVEQVLEVTLHKTADVWPPTTRHESYPSKTNQTCGPPLEI